MLNRHNSGGDRWNDDADASLKSWGIAVAWIYDAFPVTHEKSMLIDGDAVLISTFSLADQSFTQTRDYGIVSTD